MRPAGLVVGGNITPRWMLDGASFCYADGAPHDTVILRVDGPTGQVTSLLDVARTRKALVTLLGRDLPYKGLPFDSVIELGEGRYRFSFEGAEYVLSTNGYALWAMDCATAASHYTGVVSRAMGVDLESREAPRSYRRPMWMLEPMLVAEVLSPDGCWFASVKDGNILLRAIVDDRTMPLTTDGTADFAWDIEAPRLRVTAGIHLGQHLLDPWSPDGNRLFAIKVDRRAVPELPLIRYLKREEEICTIKVQRAGGPMDVPYPHVLDVLAKRAVPIDLGQTEDRYFVLIGWLPNGSEVLFTRHSRDFKTVDVLASNPVDGAVRTILSESAQTFVAIQLEVIFHGDNHIAILPDGSGLIWRSSRSGWNHFYLYAIDGTLIRALTEGEYPVIDIVAVDQEGDWVYFTAHHDQHRPYDTHLCRVKLTGSEVQRLTPVDGQNTVSISPAKKTFIVVNSRIDRPFRTDFHACDGKHLATVHQADVAALDALGHVTSEEFTVTAADGKTQLWGVMHKPVDFDPKKKYPVIDHLYGGPQYSKVAHHFGLGEDTHAYLDRALAQLGYIVISVDARGTPERSKAFQDVVYRNFGRYEIADHVETLQQLAQRYAFIDIDQAGVWGHSWGGYFTIRALAQAPDLFRAGVAVAPATDPYDAIFYEPYLDLPTRAKAAYDYANNHDWADRIKGKLMLITGTSDPFVYSNTLEMAHYLIQAGIDHEFVVLPESGHHFLGKEDEYFVRKLVKHFEAHLKSRKAG
jgi:dipeptidyl aminopeptidase/acylaminoacyl peptidase